jgi:hypothetical protein
VTAALRDYLRRERDARVRALIDWNAEPRCGGCGVERFDSFDRPRYLDGCAACAARRRAAEGVTR